MVQLCATEDIDQNFEKCSRLVEECAEKGAQMVCLPEHFAYMTQNRDGSLANAFEFDDKLNAHLFQKYKQLALDNQVWLSLGCFPEKDLVTGKNYLTHYIINQESNVAA